MKRTKLCATLLVALALTCAAGGAVTLGNEYVAPVAEESQTLASESATNDTSVCNTTAPETQAVEVPYDGTPTGRYGVQAYAGVSGPAWIIGNNAAWADYGTSSHPLGSNTGDGRNNLSLTLKLNSTVEGKAYVWIYLEGDPNKLGQMAVSVNGGESSSVDLKSSKKHQSYGAHDPAVIEVTLIKGVNSIVLTTGEDYTGWYHAFAVSPYNDTMGILEEGKTYYSVATLTESSGSMSISSDGIGLNAFDNAADYGKTGSVTYKFYAPKAGDYNVGMFVMAGNALANRAKLTLNGTVLTFDGNPYYAFDTSAGWSGDSWNTMKMTLNEGINTLTLENSLTYVNSGKTQVLDETETGGVYVSNWWMHQFCLERVPQTYLELDTSAAIRTYNPYRTFTSEGLVVKYMVDGEATVLTEDKYTVSTPDLTSFGSKEIVVTMNDTDLTASYTIAVGNEGQAFEGQEIAFNGTESTGKLAYYHYAKIEGEGTDVCEGRIFYIISDKTTEGGGWRIGSNGIGPDENRQVTLTLNVNNAGEAGTYLVKSYVIANNYDCDYATITVNGGESRAVNLGGAKVARPYIFEVQLEKGQNTITIKTQEQYSIWWEDFEICPIDGTLKDSYTALEGIRAGIDCIDTSEKIWVGSTETRSLSYYLNITEADRYTFVFNTEAGGGKSFTLVDNGQESTVTLDTTGETTKVLTLSAGLHKISIACSGTEGDFDFYGFTLEKFVEPDSISLDTSELNTQLENGASLNVAKLKVVATYGETQKELAFGEYELIYPENYSNTVAGTYTITVKVTDTSVTATFELTIKAVREATGLEVNVENVKTELENGEMLNTTDVVVKLVYNDGTKTTLAAKDYNVKMPSDYEATKAGTYTVTVELVSDTTIYATFEITVKEKAADSTSSGCKGSIGASALVAMLGASVAVAVRKKKED